MTLATFQASDSTNVSIAQPDLYVSLLNKSFLFSSSGTQEDYAHQLLELNGLACQLNQLLQQAPQHHCAQSAVGVVIPSGLTAKEAYQLGTELGQQEHQHFAALALPPQRYLLPEQLLVLSDWWSQSYLAHYGQLLIDATQSSDTYIHLEVLSTSHITLKQDERHPDCAFYGGIIAGFFSGLVNRDFEVIEPNWWQAKGKRCQFLMAPKAELDAQFFWQTVDTLST